ncbi:hypothetical protein QAD02_017704 [Eretmocerus hayati]|uniref:Uncharacterized protein n=1 Tax=Eretmocerus hayati TaxID=131215 RepID=A0ACC2PHL0_9HYME|nr:hypothetical protein QAD02_017704 [Eretmocerus hayati]
MKSFRVGPTTGLLILVVITTSFAEALGITNQNIHAESIDDSLEWASNPSDAKQAEALTSQRLKRAAQPISKKYQSCVAPGSKPGHCKPVNSCKTNSRLNTANSLEYACVIEEKFIGVCCADDDDDLGNNDVPKKTLAGTLPFVADLDEQPSERGSRASRGCGVSPRDEQRVTGGRPAAKYQYPWVAAILKQNDPGHHCGGVLITDRHVLTAAHCLNGLKPRQIKVRLGEYDLQRPNETRSLDFNVSDFRIHKRYTMSTYANDIAILKLRKPTPFNTYIWPICLPPANANYELKDAVIIGWGATSYGGANSYVLKEVTVPVWQHDVCKSKFTTEITPKQICAGAYEGNGDACQGDSGGPLLHQLSNGRWVTIGIVSWGINCGEPDRPGIYTRVTSYLDWIFSHTVF